MSTNDNWVFGSGKARYVSRVWFCSGPGKGFDVLGVLSRALPAGLWEFKYRFRYYRDEKVFDSADRKSFTTATWPKEVEESAAVEMVAEVVGVMLTSGLECDELAVESDDRSRIIELLAEKRWMNLRFDLTGVMQ